MIIKSELNYNFTCLKRDIKLTNIKFVNIKPIDIKLPLSENQIRLNILTG